MAFYKMCLVDYLQDATDCGGLQVQLQLGVRAQDHDHVGGGLCRQLVQLRHALLMQLQLDVQAHLDRVGRGQRCHPVLQSRPWE